ncbi:hypothetical protein [Pseudohalioglobus lutimaris]|uniref:Uncharacterized protein n=1 Tax=Pseudohalioglobus lutimaris TaxID=1737061 RepID=A0A2N5X285_9GAMM|nr:hypothetical protein [Pseudohalioglobus lutimaris]PLW68605.1 hypothetical protein C0039_11345 [Pseudohalioglobus lutimaris]
MKVSREAVALVAGIALCILAVTPFVLAINYFDWGVSLVLAAPAFVWLLLWAGKKLERWARNEPDTLPPDPDYPDEEA